jgi:formylglycine-generating enzyme required for sulfatase activity
MGRAISYLDFDLLVRRTESGYRAEVLSSPAGEATADFAAPFSEHELADLLLRVGRPRGRTRRIDSPEMEAVKILGKGLYDAVFRDKVRDRWHSSWSEAEAQNAGLRLRLRIADAPELNDVPWEYLYNGDEFLSLSAYTPLVRYLHTPERIRPLLVDGRLDVLVMISSPTDYPALDVEGEWSRLSGALAGSVDRCQVRLQRLPEAQLTVLQRELRHGEYHILHFIGHAGFDRETQSGVLILHDEAGRGKPVAAEHIGTILHDHRSLRLVVLNACEGAHAGRTDPFAGVAQTLVRQGTPAVIAMQFEITDQAAITFADEFYAALADGHPVDGALADARKRIFATVNDIEWGTPVLYLRAPDGRLFSINRETPTVYRVEERERAEAARKAAEGGGRILDLAALGLDLPQRPQRPAWGPAKTSVMVIALIAITVMLFVGRWLPGPVRATEPQAELFRDCAVCPELVRVPAGDITMAWAALEADRHRKEGPPHKVTVAEFALGRTQVTFAEWDACVVDGGCNPVDAGSARQSLGPVINVSWIDAQAYVLWLNGQTTGRNYRLPSDAEWELAAQRGPPYLTGSYDMQVSEWVEDCWHQDYSGAPKDGKAWDADRCKSGWRVVRGGSQPGVNTWKMRAEAHDRQRPAKRGNLLSFRVARTLIPGGLATLSSGESGGAAPGRENLPSR